MTNLERRLYNAKLVLWRARENCPHWEYLGEIEFPHDCCWDVLDAKQELRMASAECKKAAP